MSRAPSDRTRVRRLHKRADYDAQTVHAILDAMPLCHVGYMFNSAPFVTPTLQWREGNHIYWHGSAASRMLEACENAEVCVTVTILDGMVMARSAFNHSCNYRSVMALGTAEKIKDARAKEAHLRSFTERLYPGRWDLLRPATTQEIKATTVLRLKLDECSAKVRTGPPGDDEADYALPIWAGVIPVALQVLPAIADPRNLPGVVAPAHVSSFRIG
jgi:hypothetical protein